MKEIWQQFVNDGTFARRLLRAIVLGAGLWLQQGGIDGLPPWVGALIAMAALMVAAGERNDTPTPRPPQF